MQGLPDGFATVARDPLQIDRSPPVRMVGTELRVPPLDQQALVVVVLGDHRTQSIFREPHVT